MDDKAIPMFLSAIAFFFMIRYYIIGSKIVAFLKERGHSAHMGLFKAFGLRYIHMYRKITIEETGKPGPLIKPLTQNFITFLVVFLTALLTFLIIK